MRLTDSLTLQCKQAFPLCFEVASINLRLAEKKHQFSSQGNASFSNAFKVHFLRKIMYYFRAQGMTLTFGPIPNSESSVIVQKCSCWQKEKRQNQCKNLAKFQINMSKYNFERGASSSHLQVVKCGALLGSCSSSFERIYDHS